MENSVERLDRLFRHRRPGLNRDEQARLLGVNPNTYRATLSRGELSKSIAAKAAAKLNTSMDWILEGRGTDPTGVNNDLIENFAHITVPVLSWSAARRIGNTRKIEVEDMRASLPVPIDFPGGPNSFALPMSDDSMVNVQTPHAKSYAKGDRLIFDPDAEINIGDLVLAEVAGLDQAVFRRYHSRGFDDDGTEIIELAPLNPAYPSYAIDARRPGRIIARLIGRIDFS